MIPPWGIVTALTNNVMKPNIGLKRLYKCYEITLSTKNVFTINFSGDVFGDFLPYFSVKFGEIENIFGKTIIFGETIVLPGHEEQVI